MKKNERTEEEYRKAAKESFSFAGMCRALGFGAFGANYRRVHKAVEEYGIDVSHFTGMGWNVSLIFNPNTGKKTPLTEILKENSPYESTNRLKLRLIEEGLKEHKCERCGREIWEGEPIPIELHHVNGKRDDNRLENLQILCPNCHALTDNYCRAKPCNKRVKPLTDEEKKNKIIAVYGEEKANNLIKELEKKKRPKKEKVILHCEYCGREIKNGKFCSRDCSYKSQRKLPEDTVLLEDFKNGMTNTAIAKKYNTTEACVRKHRRELLYG